VVQVFYRLDTFLITQPTVSNHSRKLRALISVVENNPGRDANDLWFVMMPLPLHHLLRHYNPDWVKLSVAGLPRLSWKRGH